MNRAGVLSSQKPLLINMTSTSTVTLTAPVRILLRISPDRLDSLIGSDQPDVNQADTKLIQMFSSQMRNCDNTKVLHLLTWIGKRALIVFDYDVSNNDCQPRVAAFDVNLDGFALSIKEFKSPTTYVNRIVQVRKDRNAHYDWQFPSRTD